MFLTRNIEATEEEFELWAEDCKGLYHERLVCTLRGD